MTNNALLLGEGDIMNGKIYLILGISFMIVFGKGMYSVSQADQIERMIETATYNRLFAWDLYAQLKEHKGNLFYSPYSISTALAMVYNGARGETASQIAQALRFPDQYEPLNEGFSQLNGRLLDLGESAQNTIYLGNALWIDRHFPLMKTFQQLTRTYYKTSPFTVNFQEMPEEARKQVNSWVSEQTFTKIPELLQQGDITPNTALTLTNAIYFKGVWYSPFDETQTINAPFWSSPDSYHTVPMMQKSGDFEYAETENFQILALPYAGDRIFMIIFLPYEKDGLPLLEAQLHDNAVMQWLDLLQAQKVAVSLPKFSTRSRLDLLPILQKMGLENVSNFSGISEHSLVLEKVIHEATVDVNEQGTEATAATAATMGRSLSRFWDFTVDHPFLFFILDTRSHSLLFIGRITDLAL